METREEETSKLMEDNSDEGEESDEEEEIDGKKVIEAAAKEAVDSGESAAGKQVISKEELGKMLPCTQEMLLEEQRAQPRMKAMMQYKKEGQLPNTRLERIRLLEQAPFFDVNAAGLLCKVRMRDEKGRLPISMQVVVPESLQGMLVAASHQNASGHASALRTYQRLRENFYWPGMWADCEAFTKYCPDCQLHAEVKTKAPIQRHVSGNCPGDVWVIDLLHLPTSNGYEYLLVAVDAFSRYAEAVALKDRKAATIVQALVDRVLAGHGGMASCMVCDQGSEFKKEMAQVCQQLQVGVRYTASHRSLGHGMVERYNRTLKNTLKRMLNTKEVTGSQWEVTSEGKSRAWEIAVPWAVLAYNSSVHKSLSQKGEGLSPAEVYLGRQLKVEAATDVLGMSAEVAVAPEQYAAQVKEEQRKAADWVKECREAYNHDMEMAANARGKKMRSFEEGDTVWLRKPVGGSKKQRKLERPCEGPFQVIKKEDDVHYTLQKVGEGVRSKCRVHVDRIGRYHDEAELAMHRELHRAKEAAEKAVIKSKLAGGGDIHEVERILDERGTIAGGDKMYRIRWKGYGSEDDTWEALDNLVHCSDAVTEFNLRKVGIHRLEEGQATTLTWDLMPGGRSAEQHLKELCDAAQCKMEDVLLIWSSPPCETMSRCGRVNEGKGSHYRERGRPRGEGPLGRKAKEHDMLIQHLQQMAQLVPCSVIENPAQGLARQAYMDEPTCTVDLCAFGWPFKKPTDLWISGFVYEPCGDTGDGRCGKESCKQGEVRSDTGRVRHYRTLGGEPERGPRGKGATALSHGMPKHLLGEILNAARIAMPDRHVVLDLCAGHQSWREVAIAQGMRYVAVDLKGELPPREQRRLAVGIWKGEEILAIQRAGSWQLPSTMSKDDGEGLMESVDQALMEGGLRLEDLRARWGCAFEAVDGNFRSDYVFLETEASKECKIENEVAAEWRHISSIVTDDWCREDADAVLKWAMLRREGKDSERYRNAVRRQRVANEEVSKQKCETGCKSQ